MDEKRIKGLTPERLFKMKEVDQIRIGDIISGVVESYDFEKRRVYLKISPVTSAYIQLGNFAYPPVTTEDYMSEFLFPKEISGYFHKKILGMVIAIHEGGIVELDRRSLLEKSTETIANNIGAIVTATVEKVIEYGIFADIGNGVRSLIHYSECSVSKYRPLGKFLEEGQILPKVKIFDFDPEKKFFQVSIKQAYERIEPLVGSVEKVRVCGSLSGGKFVELNPVTKGIMDISPNITGVDDGDYAWVVIKRNSEEGFHSNFISIC